MGNLIVGSILALLFGGIIYYLVYMMKTKGTTCTSCTSCPIVEKCDKDTMKNEMLEFYKSQV